MFFFVAHLYHLVAFSSLPLCICFLGPLSLGAAQSRFIFHLRGMLFLLLYTVHLWYQFHD